MNYENISAELATDNYMAVAFAKSGNDRLPHNLYRLPHATTVVWAIGEFLCSGLPGSDAMAELVYPDGDFDITEEEFDRRVELLIQQNNQELKKAAEYAYEWTLQVKRDAHGWRFHDD